MEWNHISKKMLRQKPFKGCELQIRARSDVLKPRFKRSGKIQPLCLRLTPEQPGNTCLADGIGYSSPSAKADGNGWFIKHLFRQNLMPFSSPPQRHQA